MPSLIELLQTRLTTDVPFEIRHINPTIGYGVFAKVDIPEGTSLFVETPLLSSPYPFDFPIPLIKQSICAYCCKYLKSLEHQLNLFLGEKEEIKSLPNIDSQECYLSELEPCSMACGELYCSQKCRERDWEFSHKMICPKVAPGWEDFFAHSVKTENFVNFCMGAKLLAHIINSENSAERVKESMDAFLKYFYHKDWKETVLVPDGSEPTRLLETLTAEITTSLDLLKKLFEPYSQDGIYSPLFTLEFYSKILGAFNLNNIAVEIESPLSQYVLQVHTLPRKFKTKAVDELAPLVDKVLERKNELQLQNGKEEIEEEEEEEDEEYADEEILEWKFRHNTDTGSATKSIRFSSKLFPDYEGSGLFPLISKFNHSCAPNVTMEFADTNTAFAIASRDIRAGDEMMISYVDLRMDYADRKRDLNQYFFVCKCGVCEIEQRQTEN